MTIETKFDIGDYVYLIYKSFVRRGVIKEIYTESVSSSYTKVEYKLYIISSEYPYPKYIYIEKKESLLFKTKQELIESL